MPALARALRAGVCLACAGTVFGCALPEIAPDRYAAPSPGVPFEPPPDRETPPTEGHAMQRDATDSAERAGPRTGLSSGPTTQASEAGANGEASMGLYTLAELIEIALDTSPVTRQKWQQARAAADAWASARGAYYPSLRGSVSGAYSNLGPSVGTSSFKGWQGSERLMLDYLLFDFGGRSARARAAKEVLLSANWNHSDAIQQLIRNVAQSYYAYLGDQAQLASSLADVASAQASYDAAKAQHESGNSTIVAVHQASAQLEQARASVARNEGTTKVARGQLATAIGWPADAEFGVVGDLEALPVGDLDESIESYIDMARAQRPDLEAVRASVRQMEAELQKAKAARWPQLKLAGAIGGEQIDASNFTSDHLNSHAQLRIEVPLFEGFTLENNVRQANANLEASRAALQIQEEIVVSDVWTAYYQFRSAHAELEASKSGLTSSEASFAGSLERFKSGAADLVELIQAQSTLADSRAQVVGARTNLFESYAQLVYAIGGASADDEVAAPIVRGGLRTRRGD